MEIYNHFKNLVYFFKKYRSTIFLAGVVFIINFLTFVQTNQKSQEVDLIKEVEAEVFTIDSSKEALSKIQETTKKFEEKIEEEKIEVLEKIEKKPAVKKVPTTISIYGLVFEPPVQYKRDSLGRMVCIHENDKPKISNKNKPVHKDMECCLDPDEFPNPYCHYPREKYGKLLDDFDRKYEKFLRRYNDKKGIE